VEEVTWVDETEDLVEVLYQMANAQARLCYSEEVIEVMVSWILDHHQQELALIPDAVAVISVAVAVAIPTTKMMLAD
jgi:hypothetical protein